MAYVCYYVYERVIYPYEYVFVVTSRVCEHNAISLRENDVSASQNIVKMDKYPQGRLLLNMQRLVV